MGYLNQTKNIRYTSKMTQVRALEDFTLRGKTFKTGQVYIVEGYVGYVTIDGTIFTSFEYAMLIEQRCLGVG